MSDAHYTCPVYGYPGLTEPSHDEWGHGSFDICPSCGVEFGYEDCGVPHEELRRRWLQAGARWFSTVLKPPPNWDPIRQIKEGGLSVPPPVPITGTSGDRAMTMTFTPMLWDALRKTTELEGQAPAWALSILRMSFDEASRLQELRSRPAGPQRLAVKVFTLEETYLNFLRAQLEVEARGSEWLARIRRRLTALGRHAGREILQLDLYVGDRHYWAQFLHPSLEFLYAEWF